MEIYLDNAATTVCDPLVKDLMVETMMSDYGNPSSLHTKGVEAEKYVREASERIAKTLHCRPSEIVFTSGGTESNNLALIGAAKAGKRKGMHIITTCIEHPSVKKVALHLQEERYEVTFLPAGPDGLVDPDELERNLREDTILVSVMMVNNEIGSIQPIQEMADRIRAKAPQALFHVDAIQAYGKYPIHPKEYGIDLMSVSSHKIHGPKGVGFLYIRDGVRIVPILYGGGQQKGMRSGTINVTGIAGLGLAAELAASRQKEMQEHLTGLRAFLKDAFSEMEGAVVNGADDPYAAMHVLNVSFPGIRSEVMLHALEDRGIYVSSGSACASNHPSDASTLMSIGRPKEITDSAIRFSLSRYTTKEQLEETVQAVGELVPMLGRYRRR